MKRNCNKRNISEKKKEKNTDQVERDHSTYIRGGIQIREEQLCFQNTNYVCLFSAPTRNPLHESLKR